MTTKKNLLPEVKMTARTWVNPAVRQAEIEMIEARRLRDAADRSYKLGLSDREHQERREAEIAAHDLGEPYYPPRNPNLADDGHDMMSHGTSIVHRWISDDDLAQREAALKAAEAAFQKAEAHHLEVCATAEPVSETEIRAQAKKLKATFAVNKEMKIGGELYTAGQVIPNTVLDGLPWVKVERWKQSGLLREVI